MEVEIVGKFLSTLPEDDDHPYRTGPWRPQTTEWDANDLTAVEGQTPQIWTGSTCATPKTRCIRRDPYMRYGVVDQHNALAHYLDIPLPGPRLPHDMAFTENHAIINDFPLFWDPRLLERNVHLPRFHPDMSSRIAVVPHRGTPDDIRWFEADPTFVLHFTNSYEDGDEIVT